MTSTELQDKIRGSIMGGAIGDALGYQIEFAKNIQPKQFTRFKNNQGIFSDDTQMTLFTACGLLWRETRYTLRGIAMVPAGAIHLSYLDWLATQQRAQEHQAISWIRNIPELNILRDPGMTCISALSSGKAGTLNEPINDSKGCGGIMRVAPIGIFSVFPGQIAAESCALTHGHPLAILSAFVLASTISYIVNHDYSIIDGLNKSIDNMNDWKIEKAVHSNNTSPFDTKFRNVNPWPKEKKELTSLLRKAIDLAKSDVDDQSAICQLGEGWVAEESLAIAIFSSIRYSDDFESAVVCAINHDGDSDSTGSITGNIVGAKVGLKKIPTYFKDQIELKNTILEIADDLTTGVPTDKSGQITDERWLKKYLWV